jgi:hypothetical protein
MQSPLLQPLPQWAASLPQYPAEEQQLPLAQFPHTVLPNLGPQVPSVVLLGASPLPLPELKSTDQIMVPPKHCPSAHAFFNLMVSASSYPIH